MTLEEAKKKVGQGVTYKPWADAPKDQWEYGTITSVTDSHVFVSFNKASYMGRSVACRAEDLS